MNLRPDPIRLNRVFTLYPSPSENPDLWTQWNEDRHPWHECILVRRGRYQVRIDGEVFSGTAGDCFCYLAGTTHASRYPDQPGRLELDIIQWFQAGDPPPIPQQQHLTNRRLPEAVNWLADLDERGDDTRMLLTLMLDELARPARRETPLMDLTRRFLHGYFSAPYRNTTIRLDDLAAAAGVSRFHFLRSFKVESGGVPPMAWVIERQLQLARELFETTHLTVAEVGERVGLTTPEHLSRSLKRRFGAPPGELRRRVLRRYHR